MALVIATNDNLMYYLPRFCKSNDQNYVSIRIVHTLEEFRMKRTLPCRTFCDKGANILSLWEFDSIPHSVDCHFFPNPFSDFAVSYLMDGPIIENAKDRH